MAQAKAASFSFKSISVQKDQVLGVGAYGTVYCAQCDELPCAAKVLHGELILPFQQAQHVPASQLHKLPANRFQQECDFLSKIRHPNIVMFLGISQDPATNLPVLLMELMDGNLTMLLENPENNIPFRTQVNICHDIAQALSFLHSNDIIHRDLSSNNILMIGDRRAKVTDFGMAIFEDAWRRRTETPGTAVYMPPEVKGENPLSTDKTDVFSFGVLIIQVITRQFPKPVEANTTFNLWDTLTGANESEIEKRQNHISLISKDHPLRPIALSCLKESHKRRPTSSDLCQLTRGLRNINYTPAPSQPKLQEPGNDRVKPINKPVAGRDSLHDSLAIPKGKHQNFTCSEQYSKGQMNKIIEEIGKLDMEEFEVIQLTNLPFLTPAQVSDLSEKVSLRWVQKGQKMPQKTRRSTDCVFLEDNFYLLSGLNSSLLYSFHPLHSKWSKCPNPPVEQGSLAVVGNRVVLVGGKNSSKLYSLVDGEWKITLPSMKYSRHSAVTVSTQSLLIVIGGIGKGRRYLRDIEVLDVDSRQWSTVASFPEICASSSACISGCHLYVLGQLNTVFSCDVDALINSSSGLTSASKPEEIWESVESLPVSSSTCVSIKNTLYAVGGKFPTGVPTDAVYHYNPVKKSWSVYSHMHVARSQCFIGLTKRNTLAVMGGVGRSGEALDSVETVSYWKNVM